MHWPWKHDPGPCPVCDAPHTTCTSPDYPDGAVVVPSMRMRARQAREACEPPAEPPPPQEFTTTTYDRAKLRGKRRR